MAAEIEFNSFIILGHPQAQNAAEPLAYFHKRGSSGVQPVLKMQKGIFNPRVTHSFGEMGEEANKTEAN